MLRWKNFHLGYEDLGRSSPVSHVITLTFVAGKKKETRARKLSNENEKIVLHDMKLYTVQCSFYFHYRSVFMMAW